MTVRPHPRFRRTPRGDAREAHRPALRLGRLLRASLAGVLVASVTAGCGLGADSLGSTPPPPLDKSTIKVGIMPIVDCAPFFLAQKKGFFADEGLKVEPVMIQGGAEGVPKLKSGALDVSFGNYVSFIQAQASGMKIHIMAEGYQATDGLLAVMAPPSSGIEGPEDLAGKTIAVNTLNNVGTLTVKSVLRTYGVDLNSVHFVAVPFPRMIQALRDGDADAAWMVEPFISAAKQALGAYMVLDSASGATEGLPVGGYVTTQRFVKEHPRTAAAFHRAIVRGERLAASRSQVEKILPDYTKMDRETVALVGIGRYPTSVDQTRLQRVADLMKEFGILKKRLDVGTMIS